MFVGVRQRGGGIGSVIGGLAKYAIPLFKKYILPHAKEAVIRTVTDVTSGSSGFKKAAKTQGFNFLKNIGSEFLQSGKGVISRRKGFKSLPSQLVLTKTLRKAKKDKSNPRKLNKRKAPKKRAKKNNRSRRDFLS